ncbi:DUF262 domain-containing protein [Blastococcus sp. SYSU DS0539]
MTGFEDRNGFLTSYAGLFAARPDRRQIRSIRIPLIQRDYAQGRPGPRVEEIRASFLDVLHGAVSGDPVGLDFVYGDVDEDGTLLPLDGQQRLTTLFLLHWYLCIRIGDLPADQAWSRFSYDTRASARRFCERIGAYPPPKDEVGLADWIVDQPWFLHGWRIDPTISSMLTMIDAIERRFTDIGAAAAWSRLLDEDRPAVTFLLLPIEEVGAGDELYIKMNSRGKPLTPFENFKARLEQTLAWSPERAKDLAHKIDGRWADLLWPLRGDDDIVDDEFMRLLEFVIEVCEWRENRIDVDGLLHQRAAVVFGAANPEVDTQLSFLFDVFDVWTDHDDLARTFAALFTASHQPVESGAPQPVVLFGTDEQSNLFADCCYSYGQLRGKARAFSLAQTLLLYAVLLHRMHDSADFPRRLRILRNLLAASVDEVRRENMPKLVADVKSLVLEVTPAQALASVNTFTRALVSGELEKLQFLDGRPDLSSVVYLLEDHDLLRGSLSAFDLEPAHLDRRADAFTELFDNPAHWPQLTAALLAAGDYQRRRPNSEAWQFGTGSPDNDGVWRSLFSGARADVTPTRGALTLVLDAFSDAEAAPAEFLTDFTGTWLEQRRTERRLDWRYYLVRYPCMREGGTGIYYGIDGVLGYSLCMLRRTQLNSNYRDPFLLAVLRESGVSDAVRNPWFTGWPTTARWMELLRSGTGLRAEEPGFTVNPSGLKAYRAVLEELSARRDDLVQDEGGFRIPVAQREHTDGSVVDVEDRVVKGAVVLKALVEGGL